MILVAGATGYIGSRVVKTLAQSGAQVRCFVRRPTIQKLDMLGIARKDNKNISYIEGNVLNYDACLAATKDIDTVYYFIHHMASCGIDAQDNFDKLDRLAIENIIKACNENKVKRIIYFGRLSDPNEKLSRHLASRKEVENIITNGGIDYTVFRSPMIIGRGAASFEILDSLVRKIPIIPVIDMDKIKIQPIFYKDAIKYLVDCLDKDTTINRCFNISGKDILTHEELIRQYAKELNVKRYYFKLAGEWKWGLEKVLSTISPINKNTIHWLIDSLSNSAITNVGDMEELKKIFSFEPLGFQESIEAILNENA